MRVSVCGGSACRVRPEKKSKGGDAGGGDLATEQQDLSGSEVKKKNMRQRARPEVWDGYTKKMKKMNTPPAV